MPGVGAPNGGPLGCTTSHEVIIEDDESAATVAFEVAAETGAESAGFVSIALTLSSARTEASVVEFGLTGTAAPEGVDS